MRFKAFATAIILFILGRPARAEALVTFNNQVVRIFQQHCQTCHRPGNIAPFSLLTYADTRPWARAIRDAVLLKKMPPWKPVGSHGVFEGERSLTEQEIQTISQWVNDGAREGDAGDLPEPLKFPEAWSAGTPEAVLQPAARLRIYTFAATKCSQAIAPSFTTSCSLSMNSISPQRSRATTRVLDIRVLVAPVFFSDSEGWADGYLGHLHKCSHWERVSAFRKARGL